MKKFFAVLLSLLLIFGISLAEEDAVSSATLKIDLLPPAGQAEGSRILVVYFSPDDTVRAAAYSIAGALSADLFEIVPVQPYTEEDLNYRNSKSRSMAEMRDSKARPEISALPEDLGRYETVILGYPIWGGEAPRIISTFLESVDLSGKTVIPFCTSNSSGIGSSDSKLHALADSSVNWEKGTRIPKGSTAEEIAEWAKTLPVPAAEEPVSDASPSGEWHLFEIITDITGCEVPESAGRVMQRDLYRSTVNNVEITVLEAGYDGMSLFLEYSFRMLDVDVPLGVTAAEAYGDELPEGLDPDSYVYGMTEGAEDLLLEHNVGWWIDEIWINGLPLEDMPEGSGQYVTGTAVPGELLETDIWRLDQLDVSLQGKVQVSLPVGDRQDLMDYIPDAHPEKYDENGLLLLPDRGIVTFEYDAADVFSSVQVSRSGTETVLPEVTVTSCEAVFSPVMTYITLDLAVNPEVMAAFIAENGEGIKDDDGEIIWYFGGMDVFDEWVSSLTLTDGDGNVLFPDFSGPDLVSDDTAEFLCPALTAIPEKLFLAPWDDEEADMDLAVQVFPAG